MSDMLKSKIDEMLHVFELRSKECTYKNIYGQDVGVSDYCAGGVTSERIHLDKLKLTEILKRCQEELSADEFHIALAAFCNYYIEQGLDIVTKEEHFGLHSFFSTMDEKDIVYCIYRGVKEQDFVWFESILENDVKCTVANMYLFVRSMSDLTYTIAVGKHISNAMEEKVWSYYENMNEYWKEYAIQEPKEYPLQDRSPLPYICCTSLKEHMMKMVKWNFEQILNKLDIDISTIKAGQIYSLIMSKYGYNEAIKKLMEFVMECNGKVSTNVTEEEIVGSKELKEKVYQMQINMADTFSEVAQTMMEGSVFYGKTELESIVLFEKLAYFSNFTDDQLKENTKFECYPYPDEESSVLARYGYLHLPVVPYDSISKNYILGRYKIFTANRELMNKNIKIEKLNEEKVDMMDYYAHSWKHISYPAIVKEVAECLLSKKNDEDTTLANKLLKAYNSEQTLKGGIQLLQYLISNNPNEIRDKFKDSFLPFVFLDEGSSIEDIINQGLDLVLMKILMDGIDNSTRMMRCRSRIRNIDAVRESYVKLFIEDGASREMIVPWITENIYPVELDISENWKRIRIEDDSFAVSQLTEIFVELFTNSFLHGKNGFRIELLENENLFEVKMKNEMYVQRDSTEISEYSSGKGLKTLKKVLEKINGEATNASCSCYVEGNVFVTTLKIDKELMWISGR